ncbi:hypothetical protein NWF32_03505 [Pseudomonas qingdaonensis]|nr:hypothetical protein [Pseudomonas qingdaonensis]
MLALSSAWKCWALQRLSPGAACGQVEGAAKGVFQAVRADEQVQVGGLRHGRQFAQVGGAGRLAQLERGDPAVGQRCGAQGEGHPPGAAGVARHQYDQVGAAVQAAADEGGEGAGIVGLGVDGLQAGGQALEAQVLADGHGGGQVVAAVEE